MNLKIICTCACLITFVGCSHPDLEASFFEKPAEDRIVRLRQYSLEDQYKIFRYGNYRKEPPVMGLASPIAEKGAAAVPFLLKQLGPNADDLAVRDTLLIFEAMAHFKSYDVKSDIALMTTLTSKVTGMKDKEWQKICLEMIKRIKGSAF